MNELNIIVGTIAAVCGILVGAYGVKRNYTNDIKKEIQPAAELRVQLSYILKGIEDIKTDIKLQANKTNSIEIRLAHVEERAKSNTHRINKLEGKEGEDKND